jgi:ankyrin repeat protein
VSGTCCARNEYHSTVRRSPLQAAFKSGQVDIARKLIHAGADIEYLSAKSWSILSYLWDRSRVHYNSDEFLNICSSLAFDAYNVQDPTGWSCVHRAAAYGLARDMEMLIKLGACTTLQTRALGSTPIQMAATFNNVATLEVLTKYDSLHAPDIRGCTPLHLAVINESEDTMRWLLMHGANPHTVSYITAPTFPTGFEHQAFNAGELARSHGKMFLSLYVQALKSAGWNVDYDEEDFFWDANEWDGDDGETLWDGELSKTGI